MDIIVGSLLLEHDVRVTLVELAMELGVLLDRFKLLDSVDLERILASLLEEGLGLFLQLADIFVEVFSVETSAFIVCFNHCAVLVCFNS